MRDPTREGSITSSKDRTGDMDRPVLLISASDSSGAAGMQADIRVLETLNLPLRCALTAVTVQGDDGVLDVLPVSSNVIRSSIKTACEDPPGISAVKIGMLVDAPTVLTVVESLKPTVNKGLPVILDPVVRSTSGASLVDGEGMEVMLDKLLPLCTVITPNREEALWLAAQRAVSTIDEDRAADVLLSLGAGSVLLTGGEGADEFCTDTLYTPSHSPRQFRHLRTHGPVPRGTGCALSTAIAAHLAIGLQMDEAVDKAIELVVGLIEASRITGNQRLLFPKG